MRFKAVEYRRYQSSDEKYEVIYDENLAEWVAWFQGVRLVDGIRRLSSAEAGFALCNRHRKAGDGTSCAEEIGGVKGQGKTSKDDSPDRRRDEQGNRRDKPGGAIPNVAPRSPPGAQTA